MRILHFPVRSSAQFKRRTQIAIFEGMFPDRGRFRRLREHYEQGRFSELYGELIFDESEVEEGLRQGRLVVDERFARLLARCPDPLDGRALRVAFASSPRRRSWSATGRSWSSTRCTRWPEPAAG